MQLTKRQIEILKFMNCGNFSKYIDSRGAVIIRLTRAHDQIKTNQNTFKFLLGRGFLKHLAMGIFTLSDKGRNRLAEIITKVIG